jgi:hypothetical protein
MEEIRDFVDDVKRLFADNIAGFRHSAAVNYFEDKIYSRDDQWEFLSFSKIRKYIQMETKKVSSGELIEPLFVNQTSTTRFGVGGSLFNEDNVQYFLYQLLYFGFAPALLPSNDVERLGVEQHYFKWEYLNDENRKSLWVKKVITKENFAEGFGHRTMNSWSNRQLNAFFKSEILPDLLKITGIKIDIARYRVVERDTKNLARGIRDFLDNRVCDGLESIRYLQGEEILERIDESTCLFERRMLLMKWRQFNKEYKLKKSLEKIRKRLNDKKRTTRFKWQDICAELSTLRLGELQDLAFIEKIPHYLFMTKRELCVEFAKTYESTIRNVSKAQPKCINTTSILGTDINKISPEFFYSYQHNGKIFCDDIRDLNKHFSINGPKHPIDRSNVGKRLVKNVNDWFEHLTSIARTMEDFGEEEEIPTNSLLTSKSATLASVLNYPNSISLFINSSSKNLTKFLNLLQEENIISSNDISSLERISSLDSKKTLLVDLLLMKIRNDPEQEIVNGSVISTVQINISNIYNNVFK